jgi:putative hemolysin
MLITEILIVVALITVNGLLAMSELAVVSSRTSRLKAMAAQKVRGARRALALADDPGRFLSTVQIGITLIGILAGAFSGATIGDRFTNWLLTQGMSEAIAAPLAVGVVVSIITYFSLIVGELVPKQIALRRPEVVACAVAPAMTHFARISFPLVWLLDQSSKILLTILGQRSVAESTVSEEEIRTLVAEAESSGILTSEERSMISGVMRLGDRPVRAVMTPRLQVDYIDLANGDAANRARILKSEHSRLPVCDGSLDIVIGVLQAKDVADAYLKGSTASDLRGLVRTAPIVPETMDAHDIVAVLKESTVHICLVHDEYGHFEGVVTSADILESIVGDFRSAAGEPAPDIVEREDGSALVEGSMPADEFAEAFHITLPANRDYHTMAGFLLTVFGRIPKTGDCIEAHGCKFEIIDLDGRRIDKVLVTKL